MAGTTQPSSRWQEMPDFTCELAFNQGKKAMSEEDSRKTVWRHVSDIGTCMLVTHSGGEVRARPMRGIIEAEEGTVWFFTDRDSVEHDQVQQDTPSCLTYSDVKGQTFVALSGRLAVVEDRAEIDRLWNEGVEVYFPQGKDDPSLVLLKFDADHGEYWDAPSSKIVLAIKFLQAKMTGERPDLGKRGGASLS
jgi:general stress protein 26